VKRDSLTEESAPHALREACGDMAAVEKRRKAFMARALDQPGQIETPIDG
jgi:hypothetical protein